MNMASVRGKVARVLVLENNQNSRVVLSDYLEQCGYAVHPLADEQQIIPTLNTYRPDVVLLNLKMQFTDGFSVIEQIRANPDWQDVLILVVSGYTSSLAQQKAFKAGANAFLTKPLLPSDLTAKIEMMLS